MTASRFLVALLGCVLLSTGVSAQLSRVGPTLTTLWTGGIVRGVETAYDSANSVYLVLSGYGPLVGVFVNTSNQPVTAPFTILSANTSMPAAIYNPDTQSFLIVVSDWSTGRILTQRVSYTAPGFLIGGAQVVSDGAGWGAFVENRPAVAWSPINQRYAVAWVTNQFGLRAALVDVNGAQIGSTLFVNAVSGAPMGFGVAEIETLGARDPVLVWHPTAHEFGLAYTGWGTTGAFAAFRRIRPDGVVSARTAFGFSTGTFATGLDVNTATNQYIFAWSLAPGIMSATFDQFGTLLATRFVTGVLGFNQSLGLAYNAASNSLLAVSSHDDSYEVGGVEMNGDGSPRSSATLLTNGAGTLGSFYPLAKSRTGTNQWNVVYSKEQQEVANQIVASGGSAPPPVPPPPPPPPSACTIPDPFTSLGGGTCCNGGWLPPGLVCAGVPAPSPIPPPAPPPVSTCATPDPFGSLGGGACCNGGWLPPGLTCSAPSVSPAPLPVQGTCVGPDPFVTIGGGVCINGGWVPRR